MSKAQTAFDQGDFETAFAEFTRLAEEGDYEAHISLARMYAFGEGVQQNHHEARKWISTAAQHEPTPNDAGQHAYEIGGPYCPSSDK